MVITLDKVTAERMRDWAKRMAEFCAGSQHGRIQELLANHGICFERLATKPDDVKWGTAKRCYENAWRLALNEPCRFAYCEGIALSNEGMTCEHAWVMDRDGNVLDTTWRVGKGYLGFVFETNYLREAIANSKESSLLGWVCSDLQANPSKIQLAKHVT